MAYWPAPPPFDPKQLAPYTRAELEKIAAEIKEPSALQLKVLHVEPAKPRRGAVIYADGTDFDPGSGEGVYRHNGSAWVFIG